MSYWTDKTFALRTQGDENRFGYSPSAPDKNELGTYLAYLGEPVPSRTILVMGMTAGLRYDILSAGHTVVSIDNSPDAISFLKGCVRQVDPGRETVLLGDWKDMSSLSGGQIDTVVGDGVFGVLSTDNVRKVLAEIHRTIRPGGRMVTRMLLIPRGFDFPENTQDRLIEKFRSDAISTGEFAMGMRLWANFDEFYDPDTQYFHNAKSFARLKQLAADGVLTQQEHQHITRRYFGGNNFLPHQDDWESLLESAGFRSSVAKLTGNAWHQYMPIYHCELKNAQPA